MFCIKKSNQTMTVIKIKKYKTNSRNNTPGKILKLKCDWCGIFFERNKNIQALLKRNIHFCGNKCSGKYKINYNPNVQKGIENFHKHQEKMKNDKEYRENINKKVQDTNLKKFGTTTPLKSKKIQEKKKNTLKEKYGVDNPQKYQPIKEKTINTNLEIYGSQSPFGSKTTQEKSKQTIKNRYGVDHQMQLTQTKQKIKKTNLEKYDVENPFQDKNIQEKQKQTMKEKYGVEYAMQSPELKSRYQTYFNQKYGVCTPYLLPQTKQKLESRHIKETGECVSHWFARQQNPKPSISWIYQNFPKTNIPLKDLEDFIENYKQNKSSLEMKTEKLLGVEHYNRKPPEINIDRRPDFKLNNKTYLNVDGLYWHCEANKDKWYHFNLRKEFEDAGLRIIQFRGDEIYYKPQIVKSIINNAIYKTPHKLYARQCNKMSYISQQEASHFLETNHMMGPINAKHIGLCHPSEGIVSILSYKVFNGSTIKIERFCSSVNFVVNGAFSTLLTYILNQYQNQVSLVESWVDLRYGYGTSLEKIGFKHIKDTLGWKWTDGFFTYNRLQCRANMDHRKLSQQEHAEELGWWKAHDAGQRLYQLTI